MASKKVTKKYALKEFNTVGLVLIVYCLIVLFLPLVTSELLKIMLDDVVWHNINLILVCRLALMIIGTIIPFMILRLSSKKKDLPITKKLPISSRQIICQSIVFFMAASAAIFVMTAVAAYFGVSGQLVSGIGVSIEPEYMTDIIYVAMFILISPILEEYAFRGVLLNTLSKYGKYFALYASAAVFSLAHGSAMEFLPSFLMGVLLGKIALRYKSIKPTIYIHILFNLVLYISFIIPEKYSIYMAGFYGLLYIIAIVLYITKTYRPIIVRKSNSNSKVTIMFLTTFTVMAAVILFIAHSILTFLLR